MLNAEKYKDEIKTIIEQVVENKEKGAVNCEINSLTGVSCGNHSGCNDCKLKALIWLLEEYKEPILTEKEKAYLKNVIEPLNVVVDYIRKCENYTSEDNIFYTVVVRVKHSEKFNCSYLLIDFVVTEDMPFEGMKPQKKYTSEELGL